MEQILQGKRVSPRPPSQKRNDSDQTIAYNRLLPNGVYAQQTIDNRESADRVMALVMDLIDNLDYLPFFYKRLYAIGPAKFLQCAELARKVGFRGGRKFTQLINA